MTEGQKITYITSDGVIRNAEFIEFTSIDTCEIVCEYFGTKKIIFTSQITEEENNNFATL